MVDDVAKKPSPGHLAVVQDYVNTAKLLYGEEELVGPDDLRRWLTGRRLLERNEPLTPRDLRDALDLREALRALMLANNSGRSAPWAVEVFNRTLEHADLRMHLGEEAQPAIESRAGCVRGGLGLIASSVVVAMIDGSWPRLKACANSDCQWSFYDRSANRSGTWCEMAVCGSRAKMRAYRHRRSTIDLAANHKIHGG